MSARPHVTVKRTSRCIFCDGASSSPMSAEHLWPAWMAPFFQRTAHDVRIESHVRGPHSSFPFGFPPGQAFHGHNTTKKLKVVCRSCNNGWMSQIERDAKDSLTKLMLSKKCLLSPNDQIALAHWIALKVIVAEHNRPGNFVTTREAHEAFYLHRTMPRLMHIFLFRCWDPMWRSTFRRHTANVVAAPIVPLDSDPPNTQCVTIGIRDLLIFTYQSNSVDVEMSFDRAFARRIVPVAGDTISWPPDNTLDGVGAERVSSSLTQLILRTAAGADSAS